MTVNVCRCSTALMTVRRNDPSIMRLYKALRLHEALLKIEPHQAVFKMLILPWNLHANLFGFAAFAAEPSVTNPVALQNAIMAEEVGKGNSSSGFSIILKSTVRHAVTEMLDACVNVESLHVHARGKWIPTNADWIQWF